MSRCFPYPPPGYSRNGATYEALIESIKLQKVNDKTKVERKKEKKAKKERKEKHKEKRKDDEKVKKLQKNLNECQQQDSHKSIQPSVNFKEAHIKKTTPTIEQLERSDLTEEHGQPISSSHKPSYSSDSTQNSNKRKRDDPIVPDNSSLPVKPFKIRLLKKQKELDSIKETSCSISGRTDPHNLSAPIGRLNPREVSTSGVPVSKAVNGRTSLVSSNRKTVPLSQTKSSPTLDRPGTRNNDLKDLTFGRKQSSGQSSGRTICPSVPPVPSSSKKIEVVPSYGRRPEMIQPIVPPAPSVSRKNEVQRVNSGKRSINEMTNGLKEKEEMKASPPRIGKKMKKKVSKYEKLIGSWVPPVLEGFGGGDDDDWLMGSGKKKNDAASGSFSSSDLEKNQESSLSLWQPCARFLVEADIHALPYTVPF